MNIPIEIFSLFIGSSIALAIFGFLRNPQIPATLAFAGIFILTISVVTTSISIGYSEVEKQISLDEKQEIYNVNSFTSAAGEIDNSPTARSEYFPSTSVLIGSSFNCIDIYLATVGTPPSSIPVQVGMLNSSGMIIRSFGTLNVTSLTSDYMLNTFCLPDGEFEQIDIDDRVGVRYAGLTANNGIGTRVNDNNPFDTTNTYRQSYTGSWVSTTGGDMTMILYLGTDIVTEINTIEPNIFEFTNLHKVLFALLGSMLMFAGGLMVFKE